MNTHTVIVIFGITGDLASRKLLPALANITAAGKLENISILGVSRRNMSLQKIFAGSLVDPKYLYTKPQLELATDMLHFDIGNQDEYYNLKEYLTAKQNELGSEANLQVIYYLSVPPSAVLPIIINLGKSGLNTPNTKLLLEKPFGFDSTSAQDVIAKTAEYFDESQIYRIDHYLAKEMAQNILVFRATNVLFSSLWNKDHISAIDIIASESIDIEGRADFYEQTGALRDILQSHLMQLLALIIMETPNTLDWEVMPQLRAMALKELLPADKDTTTRAQYEGYRDEVDNQKSTTETFISTTLFSTDPLWEHVPITLTTGKALSQKATEIRVHFKQKESFSGNTLIFRIQPHESVEIDIQTKRPGYGREFQTSKLEFTYDELSNELPDAYEQVIIDAINSQKSLFASNDEIIESWRIVEPLQKAWELSSADLKTYKKGSSIVAITHK